MKIKIKRKTEGYYRIVDCLVKDNLLVQNNRYMFNAEKVRQAGFDRAYINSLSMQEAYENEQTRNCIITLDDSDFDIVDADLEEKKREQKEERELREAELAVQIRDGVMGIEILTKLPKDLWVQIKSYARYYTKEDLEELDCFYGDPGWYYTNDVIGKLNKMGLKLQYGDIEIKSVEDFDNETARRRKISKERQEKENAEKEKESGLRQLLHKVFSNAEKPSKEECESISRLQEIKYLDHNGPDIYGSGSWFHIDDKYFYYVINNGMDGDDWSKNNYPTGGAGAICQRISIADAREYIDAIENYIEHSIIPDQQQSGIELLKIDLQKEIEKAGGEVDFLDLKDAEIFPEQYHCIWMEYKNLYLGLSLGRNRAIVGAKLNYFERNDELWHRFGNDFIKGWHFAAVIMPASVEFVKFIEDLLPDWTKKARYGRFLVDHYICDNVLDAIRTAIMHKFPLNVIEKRLDIRLLSISKDRWKTVWDDNVVIPHTLHTERSGKSWDDLSKSVIEFFNLKQIADLEVITLSKGTAYLMQHQFHNGIKTFDLLNREFKINKIESHKDDISNSEVELNEIIMEDGVIYYEIYSVFVAPPDNVDDFYDLYLNEDNARSKYKEIVNSLK